MEVWDWLDDVGAAWRGLDAKVLALPNRLPVSALLGAPIRSVGGLFVMRRTRRNQALVRELTPLFRARFDAGGNAWLRALDQPGAAVPNGTGFLWSLADGRLTAARLRHRGP